MANVANAENVINVVNVVNVGNEIANYKFQIPGSCPGENCHFYKVPMEFEISPEILFFSILKTVLVGFGIFNLLFHFHIFTFSHLPHLLHLPHFHIF